MAEPCAQLGAWRDLLDPFVEPGLRLADAARPQAIHQDLCAVRLSGGSYARLSLTFEAAIERSMTQATSESWRAAGAAVRRPDLRARTRLRRAIPQDRGVSSLPLVCGPCADRLIVQSRASIEPSITISSHFSA